MSNKVSRVSSVVRSGQKALALRFSEGSSPTREMGMQILSDQFSANALHEVGLNRKGKVLGVG
jgi:hypothetical protein